MTNNLRPLISKNRKGMSAVITNLIIILLVIVAVGIIWTVVQGLIKESTSQISTKELTGIDATIEDVTVRGNTVDVSVRNSGTDTMTGVELIISNGRESTSFTRDQSIGSKATKVFTVENYENEVGIVKKVEIAPRYENEEGEVQSTKDTSDEMVLDNEEVLSNMDAISWWKMDGDAHDEFGRNDGFVTGDTNCEAEGNYGQACEFNNSGDYVNVSSLNSLPTAYAFWYKNDTGAWTFYYNGSQTYKNTQSGASMPSPLVIDDSSGIVQFGGVADTRVDEVVFFDRDLNENAVKALYYLELTTA